jgi:hypothetical protein
MTICNPRNNTFQTLYVLGAIQPVPGTEIGRILHELAVLGKPNRLSRSGEVTISWARLHLPNLLLPWHLTEKQASNNGAIFAHAKGLNPTLFYHKELLRSALSFLDNGGQ